MNDLESELEFELHRALDSVGALPIPARRVAAPHRGMQRLLGSTGAALALKVATGVAVAAAATTIAGAATTGSLNPTNWGQHVETAVETCKAALEGTDQHGIGDCVSGIANQHGATVSNSARHHGNANGHTETGNSGPTGGSSGTGQGQGKDKGKSHISPRIK